MVDDIGDHDIEVVRHTEGAEPTNNNQLGKKQIIKLFLIGWPAIAVLIVAIAAGVAVWLFWG